MFKEKYKFPKLPNGFSLEDEDTYTIRHIVELYDEFECRRSNKEIYSEIEDYNKKLKEWANELPYIN